MCDSLAPVIALTHAPWDGWMPVVPMAKCVRAAQLEQRNSARPWTVVKGPFGAAVATLKRMQWTIIEHDPFLWCMHDGRIVDRRRVCRHRMHTLLKKAARAWQWRRVALHEGCEGLDRGAVVALLFAALYTPILRSFMRVPGFVQVRQPRTQLQRLRKDVCICRSVTLCVR